MNKTNWSISWNRSIQPKKQKLFRYNAPNHVLAALDSSPLSDDLAKKHGIKKLVPRKGDKVKVLRGEFKGKTGAINRVYHKKSRLYIEGIEVAKKDGSKARYPVHITKVLITELNLDDKKRIKKIKKE